MANSQKVIADYDILILPSRHDGWGLVVNEALLQGIPAIVSDKVGAKCLVEVSGAGAVFENENAQALSKILVEILKDPKKLYSWKTRAEIVSNEITPVKAAEYLLAVLQFYFYKKGTRPSKIWSETNYLQIK